jgi:pyruvate/2-oxoglutarate dehydrogenase complex dihydrolipoamide acyltransferase (E2) component
MPRNQMVEFPRLQHQAIDWMELSHRKHTMYGLIDVDVTDARRAIKRHRAYTRTPMSLTAFIIWCLARAVAADPAMQAYRLGRRRLVLFGDVDVAIMVEREVDGVRMPLPYIVRSAQAKSIDQVGIELRAVQRQEPEDLALGSVPPRMRWILQHGLSVWLALPTVARRLVWAWTLADPYRRKQLTGTVGLTSVGMFGRGIGWGVTPMGHSVAVVVGGLSNRAIMVGSSIQSREYLCLTLTLDHDVIDGAPAARFTTHLKSLIESCAGLSEESNHGVVSSVPQPASDKASSDNRGV